MAKPVGWYLAELKRRRVYRVAIVYAVVAFVIWQVADILFPGLGLPDTAVSLVLILTILGFPIALVLAWAYEVTPEASTEPTLARQTRSERATREDASPVSDKGSPRWKPRSRGWSRRIGRDPHFAAARRIDRGPCSTGPETLPRPCRGGWLDVLAIAPKRGWLVPTRAPLYRMALGYARARPRPSVLPFRRWPLPHDRPADNASVRLSGAIPCSCWPSWT